MAAQQPTIKQRIFGELCFASGGYLAIWHLAEKLNLQAIDLQSPKHATSEAGKALQELITEGLVEEVPDLGERYQLTAAGNERYHALAYAIGEAGDAKLRTGLIANKAWDAYRAAPSVRLVLAAHTAGTLFRAARDAYAEIQREVGLSDTLDDDSESEGK